VRQLPEGSRPIKVVYVINSLRGGGAERMLCDLVTRLDTDLFRAEVMCLYYAGEFGAVLEASKIPVRVLGLDWRFLPRNWLRTWHAVRATDADVIHTHMPESNWYGLPAGLFNRVPVRISHLHSVYTRWSAKTRAMDRVIRTFASQTVACSETVRDVARELGYLERKLTVIPNGVDMARFRDLPTRAAARRTLRLPADGPILISVGWLYEHKGHSYLLEAMARVHQEFPRATLLLAGEAKEEQRTVLRQAVERLDLGGVVRFLGHRDDVLLLLAGSDVFVMPSLREGFPMSLLEAGAAGRPAVATSVGGIPEIVDDGVTGILVPPKDHGALAEALLSLLRDPRRMQSMGEAAHTRTEERFTLERTVGQLEDLYLELLDRQRPTTCQLSLSAIIG
jgi:glycosyltransferase involved in cell wall biosynthesis